MPTSILADHHVVRTRGGAHRPLRNSAADWYAAVARRGPLLLRSARRPASPAGRGDDGGAVGQGCATLGRLALSVPTLSHVRCDAGGTRCGCKLRMRPTRSRATACDIQLVLHGLVHVARTEAQRHVIWVISHPETLGTAEADAAGSGVRRVGAVRRRAPVARTRTPVEVLLQATDHHRFVRDRSTHASRIRWSSWPRRGRSCGRSSPTHSPRGSAPRTTDPGGRSSSTQVLVVAPDTWPTRTSPRLRIGRRGPQRPLGDDARRRVRVQPHLRRAGLRDALVISDHPSEIAALRRLGSDLRGPR